MAILEKSFGCNKKLEAEQKLELSSQLGVPPRQITVWYQNKRARWKTQSLEVDYSVVQMKLQKVMAEKKQLERDVVRLKALSRAEGSQGDAAFLERWRRRPSFLCCRCHAG